MNDALLQYGALGVCVIGLGLAVRVLFARVSAAADAERARADRNEAELRRQTETMVDRVVPALTENARVLAEVLTALREERR